MIKSMRTGPFQVEHRVLIAEDVAVPNLRRRKMEKKYSKIEEMVINGELTGLSLKLDPKLHGGFADCKPIDTAGCVGNKIITASAGYFDYADPKPENINIEDIALALSHACRFAGMCEQYYSVAEHSILCMLLAEKMYPDNEELAFAALMHDASEAFITDIPKPLKLLCPGYGEVEKQVEAVIAEKYQIETRWHEQVKEIDLMMLKTEKKHLFPDTVDWGELDGIADTDIRIRNDTPNVARVEFLTEASRHLKRKGLSDEC